MTTKDYQRRLDSISRPQGISIEGAREAFPRKPGSIVEENAFEAWKFTDGHTFKGIYTIEKNSIDRILSNPNTVPLTHFRYAEILDSNSRVVYTTENPERERAGGKSD